MKLYFGHERLNVYQASIRFVAWASPLLETLPKRLSVTDQLDRASTSIPLNIAEGNGKFTAADRCRFLDIARGSTLESAACLDVLLAKQLITEEAADAGKEIHSQIVSMLIGLIQSIDSSRVAEDPGLGGYGGEITPAE